MRRELLIIIGLLTAGIALHLPAAAQQVYQSVCNASAAIAVDAAHFLVAEDENDILWVYRNDKPRNKPVGGGFDFSPSSEPIRNVNVTSREPHVSVILFTGSHRMGGIER
jgi:hypothetical protein